MTVHPVCSVYYLHGCVSYDWVHSQVELLVGEWIPFGANNIVLINQKLGASKLR